ncbi:speckle-type POZ protein-like [Argiope bruennichi]|uniref:TD and POZ domain-containing protein 4 n=1 Tax=Argiope bruennichi TaxID=94029 RepID=A0A8T0EDE7_ARGBR|nr:speckle-type POZ protein-like [Argiope bruennichi]KAF8771036.1 TD and POZ domain-containing protein 4 [Argiope bruennichi]
MACDRKYFAITWRIENYNFYYGTRGNGLSSSSFVIDSVKDVSWTLQIVPESGLQKEHIVFYIQSAGSPPTNSAFDVELSFFNDDDSSPSFEKSFSSSSWNCLKIFNCYIPHNQVYRKKENKFKPPETLTILCRLYNTDESFSEAWQCFTCTRIQVERTAFIGQVEEFGSIFPREKRNLAIKSASAEKQLFSLDLTLAGGIGSKENIWIEVTPVDKDFVKFCVCKVFVLDSEGMKIECGKSEMLFNKEQSENVKFLLNVTKDYLTRRYSQFLSNDILTLKFEFAFSTGVEYKRIEDSVFGNLTFFMETPIKVPSALDDLTCLLKEGVLCDTKLQTETETFKAHKSILSARSSVFKSMFTADMKEKITDCVTIEDLDAEAVRLMLMFIYSDRLEDMNLEQAKGLYFAADKYNIIALKHKCSNILKSNLQLSNCCELLLLSDRHHDEDLKKCVQGYIADYREEVFHSSQWLNLEKSNPELSIETFHAVYLGK